MPDKVIGTFKQQRTKTVTYLVNVYVVELEVPTRSGYTHGLRSEGGETIGFLEQKGDGTYKIRCCSAGGDICVPDVFNLEDVLERT